MKKRPVFWTGFCLSFLVLLLRTGIQLLHVIGAGYPTLVVVNIMGLPLLYGSVILCWAVLYWRLEKISSPWFEWAGVFVLFLVSIEAYLGIPSRYWGPDALRHDDGIGAAILLCFLQPFLYLAVFSVLGLMQRRFPKLVAGVCGLLVFAATLDYGSLALVLAKGLSKFYESTKQTSALELRDPKLKLAEEKCLGHQAGAGSIIYEGKTEVQVWDKDKRDIRLFSREECEELQGNWHPRGECLKKVGGSLSWDLRGLNQTCK